MILWNVLMVTVVLGIIFHTIAVIRGSEFKRDMRRFRRYWFSPGIPTATPAMRAEMKRDILAEVKKGRIVTTNSDFTLMISVNDWNGEGKLIIDDEQMLEHAVASVLCRQ